MAQQTSFEWQPFKHETPPGSGLYWLAGTRVVWDVDVDDYGRTVGSPTNELESFVALAWLDSGLDIEGRPVFDLTPVDDYNLGKVDECDSITHFLPCSVPSVPGSSMAPSNGSTQEGASD